MGGDFALFQAGSQGGGFSPGGPVPMPRVGPTPLPANPSNIFPGTNNPYAGFGSYATGNNGRLGKVYTALSAVSMMSDLASGLTGFSAAREESVLQEKQAQLRYEEGLVEARRKAREVSRFQARQKTGYLSSGVTIEGTPIEVLEQTRRDGQEEVDARVRRSEAERELLQLRGQMIRRSGRNAMLGSLFSGFGTGIDTYFTGRRLGLFGRGTPKGSPISPAIPLPPVYQYNPAISR